MKRKKRNRDSISSGHAGQASMRQAAEKFRKTIHEAMTLFPNHTEWMRPFPARLDAIEAALAAGDGPKAAELLETFLLEINAGMGESVAQANARMVANLDFITARAEERKFQMTPAQREEIEEMMQPYQDTYREQMLSEMPIEERRKLEENASRLREEGTGDAP